MGSGVRVIKHMKLKDSKICQKKSCLLAHMHQKLFLLCLEDVQPVFTALKLRG
jgi:hypothetical protein